MFCWRFSINHGCSRQRKRNVVTLERKLEVIKELESSKSQHVADLFEISKSTISNIWNNRKKIQNHVTSAEDSSLAKKRCIVRNSQYPLLDDAINIWFIQMRLKGAPVPSCVIQLEKKLLNFLKACIQMQRKENSKKFLTGLKNSIAGMECGSSLCVESRSQLTSPKSSHFERSWRLMEMEELTTRARLAFSFPMWWQRKDGEKLQKK